MTDEKRRAMALDCATRDAKGSTPSLVLSKARIYEHYIATGDY